MIVGHWDIKTLDFVRYTNKRLEDKGLSVEVFCIADNCPPSLIYVYDHSNGDKRQLCMYALNDEDVWVIYKNHPDYHPIDWLENRMKVFKRKDGD